MERKGYGDCLFKRYLVNGSSMLACFALSVRKAAETVWRKGIESR